MTEAKAVTNLQELFDEYISARIDDNIEIPEPVQAPVVGKEIWIIVQEKQPPSISPSLNAVDTQETRGEVKPEMSSIYAEAIP